ncbi:hypothetical protein POVCU1_005550 [Plasmodium ovale curtisi]|uniref:Uncharacterized protein n=1 Tax=Plasmodium ovale curtisi TaxID=864141 RepID=A0A1A8VMD8_PLAOA|nr:hypothetical protein POVCU1_005550 [Plasmodium ovale curtisi]
MSEEAQFNMCQIHDTSSSRREYEPRESRNVVMPAPFAASVDMHVSENTSATYCRMHARKFSRKVSFLKGIQVVMECIDCAQSRFSCNSSFSFLVTDVTMHTPISSSLNVHFYKVKKRGVGEEKK